MACPLSKILNTCDQPPGNTRNEVESSRSDFDTPRTQSTNLDSSASTNPDARLHKARITIPPITFSPQKGALYNRRASKSPTRLPAVLPTPPRSDPAPTLSRPSSAEPPTPELDFRKFSVFKALLTHPELTFEFAKHLELEDLISLYAISEEFHRIVNGRFTTLILGQSVGKAAESSRTFIFRCYKNLCMHDPGCRRIVEEKEGTTVKGRAPTTTNDPNKIRGIPSFRWLRMILYRETVVDEIIAVLASEGHRLPKRTSLTLKKIWFTLDISDNARRIGLIHNKVFWTNKDLFVATMFFIKLDMHLTDPVTGNGELGMRKMLLGQRSLSTLCKVLKREEMLDQLDVLRMLVRWNYRPALGTPTKSILGVPWPDVGKLQYEGWGYNTSKRFVQIDELVMGEAVKRKLGLHNHYLDMAIHGFVNKRTFEDVWTPEQVTEMRPRELMEGASGALADTGEEEEGEETGEESFGEESEESAGEEGEEMDWDTFEINSG